VVAWWLDKVDHRAAEMGQFDPAMSGSTLFQGLLQDHARPSEFF
jgi:hypothetical protein